MVCFCTACATSLRERERERAGREILVSPFLLSAPHAEQSNLSLNLIYTAHLGTQRTHTRYTLASTSTVSPTSAQNVTEHNGNLCHPAKKHKLQTCPLHLIYCALFTSVLTVLESKMRGKLFKTGPRTHPHTHTD